MTETARLQAKVMLKKIAAQIENGEVRLEHFHAIVGLSEIEPQNNTRCWEKSGETTLLITFRKMKQWQK